MEKIVITICTIITLVLVLSLVFSDKNDNLTINNNNDNIYENYDVEKDLFFDYYDEAELIMEDMTIENKISQLFMVSNNASLYGNDSSYIGGIVLYGNFFKDSTRKSVVSYIDKIQENAKIKYAIATDEEGGTVSRISAHKNFRNSIFLSPNKLYKKGGLDLIIDIEDEKDELLKSLRINLNLAPVADVSTNPSDFMYDRTLGVSADRTAEYISEVTKRARKNGISTCLKHFPGYGNNGDTHYDVIIDKRDLKIFQNNDFKPFIAGIKAGTPFIMTSHNIMYSVDKDYPTSLSKKVIDILKNDLNYSGIIMSDDIAMIALKKYNKNKSAAILALEAGNDMIMSGNYSVHFNELVDAYKNGRITEERIDYSVRKIISWKIAYGII